MPNAHDRQYLNVLAYDQAAGAAHFGYGRRMKEGVTNCAEPGSEPGANRQTTGLSSGLTNWLNNNQIIKGRASRLQYISA